MLLVLPRFLPRLLLFRLLSGLLSLTLALYPSLSAAQAAPMSRSDYEACQTHDEESFRTALADITTRALKAGIADVNYRSIVAEEWRKGGLSDIIDKRVDIAIAEVRDESSWSDLLQSLAYQEKAQELATAVAERVYQSDAVKEAIENLAVGVGQEVGKRIEFGTQDAAEPAIACLRAFIGPRYGDTVARVVTADAGKEFSVDTTKGAAEVGAGSVLTQSAGGITGAAILVMRRQLANMAQRMGRRLVGSVLSRVVSVVAGGVGLVLIAKDIWDLRNGVLPIIKTEMKSAETKEKVQDELAKTIGEQIAEHVQEIGTKTADRVVEIWQDFRRAHHKALDLAEQNDRFKAFLDSTRPELLPRLDEVLALVIASEGEDNILKRLDDGSLDEAVNRLPPDGLTIARETRSLEQALKWSGVAGDALPQVVAYAIYRRASPDDFTGTSLRRVIGLGDRLAIVRLSSVTREARDALFDLPDNDLKSLARSLTEGELATLARYLTGLSKDARERVLHAVARSPAKMQTLASNLVRNAVLSSRDQDAAVSMMLRDGAIFDFAAIGHDVRLVADGQVSPVLLWEKHPVVIGVAALALILLLLIFRRLLFSRRRASPA